MSDRRSDEGTAAADAGWRRWRPYPFEIAAWASDNPQPFNRDAYLGLYADTSHGTAEEPYNGLIREYARDGLSKTGHHGKVASMGVPRGELPDWDDLQILTAQPTSGGYRFEVQNMGRESVRVEAGAVFVRTRASGRTVVATRIVTVTRSAGPGRSIRPSSRSSTWRSRSSP